MGTSAAAPVRHFGDKGPAHSSLPQQAKRLSLGRCSVHPIYKQMQRLLMLIVDIEVRDVRGYQR